MTIVIVEKDRTCSMMTIKHGGNHRREDFTQRDVGLGRLLDRSTQFDAIAGWKGRDQRLKGRHDLLGNLRRLGRLIDVRANSDDGCAIAALQDRLFQADFRMPNLVERNLAAVPAHQ
jgi:hypothetical protein